MAVMQPKKPKKPSPIIPKNKEDVKKKARGVGGFLSKIFGLNRSTHPSVQDAANKIKKRKNERQRILDEMDKKK